MVSTAYQENNLEQLADFFEFSPVGMMFVDSQGDIKRANVALLEIMCMLDKRASFYKSNFSQYFRDKALYQKLIGRVSEGVTVNNFEASLIVDNQELEVIIDANALISEKTGEPVYVRVFIRPATPQELPSAEAVESSPDVGEILLGLGGLEKEKYFRELNDFFDNAPVGVHFVGLNGIMMRANMAELKLLGYQDTPADYVGHHVRHIHHDPLVVETLLERLIAGTPVISHEAYLKHKDKTVVPVLIYSGLRLKGGKFQNTRCFLFANTNPSRAPGRLLDFEDDLSESFNEELV